MERVTDFFRKGTIPTFMLLGSALVGLGALLGITLLEDRHVSDMRIEPATTSRGVGETFTIQLIVESPIPVNVFAGELRFSKDILEVDSISYNTSIADLWAELPWFENGEGTLNFAGGSTRPGGFTGEGELISVTFKTKGEGEGVIAIHDPRILLHDGLGTDAEVGKPIDAIVTIDSPDENLLAPQSRGGATFQVRNEPPSTDLNGDEKQSIADVSIFMLNMAKNDSKYDFNMDGNVGLKDLNILLGR